MVAKSTRDKSPGSGGNIHGSRVMEIHLEGCSSLGVCWPVSNILEVRTRS